MKGIDQVWFEAHTLIGVIYATSQQAISDEYLFLLLENSF